MKNSATISTILASSVLAVCSYAQPQPPDTLWTKKYGSFGMKIVNCVQETQDSGFIFVGLSNSTATTRDKVYIVKTDAYGDTLWTKLIGGQYDDIGNYVQQTDDGGYIIIGETTSFGSGNDRIYLVKTDSLGIVQWQRNFGGTQYNYGRCVQQTSDGGYILTGMTCMDGEWHPDLFLLKTDARGDSIWGHYYGQGAGLPAWMEDGGECVRQTPDGGYIVTGHKTTYGANYVDLWLLRTDEEGDTLWTKTFGEWYIGGDEGWSVQITTDGGYITGGTTCSYGAGNSDVWLVKTDASGNMEWMRTFGDYQQNYGRSVEQTGDGGYVIAGYNYFGYNNSEIRVDKADGSGNWLWTKIISNPGYDRAHSIEHTLNGDYVVAGYTSFLTSGGEDAYLIRLESVEQSIIPGGDVSGNWTLAGSPYLIEGTITIPPGDTLTINPGVEVIFQGHFKLIVNGVLEANGAESDSILFSAADASVGWNGIRFMDAQDTSHLSFCVIEHGHSTGYFPDFYGGGIYCQNSGPVISYSTIRDNRSDFRGGGIFCWGVPDHTIRHCIITRNSAAHGGGICLWPDSSPVIINCTITRNSAEYGGGIYCQDSSPTVANDIVEGNTGLGGIYFDGSPNASITYSDFHQNESGAFAGTPPQFLGQLSTVNANGDSCDVFFNIFEDPLFADPENGDFQITWANYPVWNETRSPCINAGDPDSPIDPDSTISDIGALYFNQDISVVVDLTPYNAPITIPIYGGSFDHNIAVENLMATPKIFDIWTVIYLPQVGSMEILNATGLSLPGFAALNRDRTQQVPGFAPAGIYTYYAYVGQYPWIIDHYDYFTFEKEGGNRDGSLGLPSDWRCTGEALEQWASEAGLQAPCSFSLLPPHPNPFNSTTSLTFTLPQASSVKLEVYNLRGQLIGGGSTSDLRDSYPAGTHSLTFNGAHLPSGIYLARLEAGVFTQTQKLVLIK